MKTGNTSYNLVLAKLKSLYDYNIRDCYESPEYLRSAIKNVYRENYRSIINEIKFELGDLVNEKYISNFIKTLESFTIEEPLLRCPKCGNVWMPESKDTWGAFLGDDKCAKCRTKGKFMRIPFT